MLTCLVEHEHDPQIRAGANILLGKHDDAEKYFKEISSENQKAFLTYPICHFWKREAMLPV